MLKGKNVAVTKNSTDDLELQILLKDKGIEIGETHTQHFLTITLTQHTFTHRMHLSDSVRDIRWSTTMWTLTFLKTFRAAVRLQKRKILKTTRTHMFPLKEL